MANEVTSATDPLGNTIFLLEGICLDEENKPDPEVYDSAVTVIQKPALVVRVETDDVLEHYYFRSVGWHNTLLITVRFRNERWESYKCVRNPSSEELSELLKNGKQII
ncbi:MAG: hypothetical protein ACJ748_11360 [Flavisolibacter sp.]